MAMSVSNDLDDGGDFTELRFVVSALVSQNEGLSADVAALKLENEALRDEIRRLKGLPSRPKLKGKPSGMEQATQPALGKGGKVAKRKKARRGAVKSKLAVTREVCLRADAPVGARFKGYEDVLVQDLRLSVEVVRYRREVWRTVDGERVVAPMPGGILGGFGPEVRRFIAAGHFQGQITSERLTALLSGIGLAISKRQVVRLLSGGLDDLIAEDAAVLAAGLRSADWINVDDTAAPHGRRNGYVTHLGDRRFAVFRSAFSKSRRAFLSFLQAGCSHHVINDAALDRMRAMKLPLGQIAALAEHEDKRFVTLEAWEAHLSALGFDELGINPDPIKVASEGALWGAICEQGLLGDTVIVSDGAGQFRINDNHALCWVHAERLLHELQPRSKADRDAVELKRMLIWWLYGDLKKWQLDPDPRMASALRARFDRIFTRPTGYVTLDRLLTRLHRRKSELLRVLERPHIPLHTNGSENDIRAFVTKRNISGGTVSEAGRIARQTMLGLMKTCAKQGISFYQFLGNRFHVPGAPHIPWLPDLLNAAPA
jgi:hypothetical protein